MLDSWRRAIAPDWQRKGNFLHFPLTRAAPAAGASTGLDASTRKVLGPSGLRACGLPKDRARARLEREWLKGG
jgi:hypothetical protein